MKCGRIRLASIEEEAAENPEAGFDVGKRDNRTMSRKPHTKTHQLGQEVEESIPWRDAFSEFKENAVGATLAGYRHREGLTQVQLSKLAGVPQRHISEMENGRRAIGVDNAKRLAAVLHCDHRRLL